MTGKSQLLKAIPSEQFALACALGILLLVIPNIAVCGFLSWSLGIVFYRVMKIGPLKSILTQTHINLVTVGLLIGSAHAASRQISLYLLCGAVMTLLLTNLLSRTFYYYWIPVLLSPSIVVSWLFVGFQTDQVAWNSSVVNTEPLWWVAGMLTFCLFARSPIFLVLFVLGSGLSWALQQMIPEYGKMDPTATLVVGGLLFAFCASLLAMPSRKSLAWSAVGLGVFYTLVTAVLNVTSPAVSMMVVISAANIAAVLALYSSRVLDRQTGFWSFQFRPEEKLDEAITLWSRFRTGEARTGLPCAGLWTISQGFEGPWTHRGSWQHGLDFVVTDHNGKTYGNNGYELGDYYAFGKDVFAPSSGYVVAISSHFPDNPIGTVNNIHNFGNYVIIRDAYGAHSVVAHLMKDSITCKLYDYIEAGTPIGRCGNSGYSPEPHIHLHVQADAIIGSPTIAFHLTHYLIGSQFYFHGVPSAGQMLRRPHRNANLARQLSFEVGETFEIACKTAMESCTSIIENRLDPTLGVMYFTDGEAKLFHGKDQFTFYFYRYEGKRSGTLFDLMTALPRVPFLFGMNCTYSDQLPVVQWRSYSARVLAYAKTIFFGNFSAQDNVYLMKNDTIEVINSSSSVKAQLQTLCLLDAIDGFAKFAVGERQYEVTVRRKMDNADHFVSCVPRIGSGEDQTTGLAV